jgi:hypothetical protein
MRVGEAMNTQEFKAWFAGFTEGKDSLTADQLKRVRDEMAQLASDVADAPIAYPWTPGLHPHWPAPVITRTPTTVSGEIVWNSCDPGRLTAAARP